MKIPDNEYVIVEIKVIGRYDKDKFCDNKFLQDED